MENSLVTKFTRQITNGMYKRNGYIIEDFRNLEGVCPWGLSKILDDGTKTIVVFMKFDNNIFTEAFQNQMYATINCKRENLVKVILVSEDKEIIQDNTIVIDLVSGKIQISGSDMRVVANEMANIMHNNKAVRSNKKGAKVTYTIIAINIIMFIISAIYSGNFMDINTNVLINLGAKYNTGIQNGEWYRLVTCMFLHAGIVHIGANMYSLYAIGPMVEKIYGKYKYIAMYLASGIISSLFSFWFSDYVSIGASGAIFGLLGVVMVYAIKERKRIGKSFLMNIVSIVILNLFIGLSVAGIDNYAHVGGLVSGVILGAIIARK